MTSKEKPKTGLALLREPFPANQISKLPKPTKAQNEAVKQDFKAGIRCQVCGQWHHPKVVHLDYVGHAALTDRLLDCDPEWNWEPVAVNEDGTPKFDRLGGLWIRLTVCGVTRLGYGHAEGKQGGDAIKEVIGDALRNAAMRFGAALDLWHKGALHIPEDDEGGEEEEKKPPETHDTKPDPKTKHEMAVKRELANMETIFDLDELRSHWEALKEMQPEVAHDQRVIDAKDECKETILRKQKDAAA